MSLVSHNHILEYDKLWILNFEYCDNKQHSQAQSDQCKISTDGIPISSNHPSIWNLVSLTPEDSDSRVRLLIVIIRLNKFKEILETRTFLLKSFYVNPFVLLSNHSSKNWSQSWIQDYSMIVHNFVLSQ